MKVFIFNGTGIGTNGFAGLKKALDSKKISYKTGNTINSATLKGFTHLILPGGDGARKMYINNPKIAVNDIKKAQKEGLIILAICSGAYIASSKVEIETPYGWGLAANTISKSFVNEEPVTVEFTEEGKKFFNRSGKLKMAHFNGGAMYLPGKSSGILAKYTSGSYKGYAAIVKDNNTILFGPHPELNPFYSDMIIAALGNKKISNVEVANMSFSKVEIGESAGRVKAFMEAKKRIPTTVKIGKQVNMHDYLYIMAKGLAANTSKVAQKTVKSAGTTTVKFKQGVIKQAEYIDIAKRIAAYIEKNGKAPAYAKTSLGDMPFTDLVYNLTKVWNFFYTKGRLPATVTATQFGTYNEFASGTAWKDLEKGTGVKFNSITEFREKIVVPYVKYCSPIYFNNKKTPKQTVRAIVNNVKGITEGEENQVNCVDIAQILQLIAIEQGYDEAVLYGIYCKAMEIYHAVVRVAGKEFKGRTVKVREGSSIVTRNGVIADGSAWAEDNYPMDGYWCDPTHAYSGKNKSWLQPEKY